MGLVRDRDVLRPADLPRRLLTRVQGPHARPDRECLHSARRRVARAAVDVDVAAHVRRAFGAREVLVHHGRAARVAEHVDLRLAGLRLDALDQRVEVRVDLVDRVVEGGERVVLEHVDVALREAVARHPHLLRLELRRRPRPAVDEDQRGDLVRVELAVLLLRPRRRRHQRRHRHDNDRPERHRTRSPHRTPPRSLATAPANDAAQRYRTGVATANEPAGSGLVGIRRSGWATSSSLCPRPRRCPCRSRRGAACAPPASGSAPRARRCRTRP